MKTRGFVPFLLILLPALFTVNVASAHTSVTRTTPEYKSTLTEMPEVISIEFTDDLMVLGNKKINTIEIKDPENKILSNLTLSAQGKMLSAEIPAGNYRDGTYLITYRVVSADGHPISGSYEIYLNHPAGSASRTPEESHSFWHLHSTHFYQAGTILILLILWWGYRRFGGEEDQSQ